MRSDSPATTISEDRIRRAELVPGRAAVAPRDQVERALCDAWAEALRLDEVGIDDDFFALGGGSLEAARAFALIERATGRRLPLSMLYDRSTVRGLAEAMARTADTAFWRTAVTLRRGGANAALFVVPGVGGEVIGLEPFVRHLEAGRAVYSCNFPGLDGTTPPLGTIEEMAESFLREIREIQKSGPYYLMGACFGGLVALEIAQLLKSQGAAVGFLCLVDTPFPDSSARRSTGGEPSRVGLVGRILWERILLYAEAFHAEKGRARLALLGEKARRIRDVVRSPDMRHESQLEIAQRRVAESNRRATHLYAPRAYAGSALYVRSAQRPLRPSTERRRNWPALFAGGLDIYDIDCRDTGQMFADTHVAKIARLVSASLAVADSAAQRRGGANTDERLGSDNEAGANSG